MKHVKKTGLLAALFVGLGAVPATACTVAQGYRVPGNFELVHKADLIVLGRVLPAQNAGSAASSMPRDAMSRTIVRIGEVHLEPIRILKGGWGNGPLRLAGYTVRDGRGRFPDDPVRPVFTSLDQVNPSAMAGGCVRFAYPAGGLVVVLFEGQGTAMTMLSYPFARAAEDVESEDSLWVRAVDAYVEAQRGVGPDGLDAAARQLRDGMTARADDPVAQAIVADLTRFVGR